MKHRERGFYPDFANWNCDGVNVNIGGLSFEGAKRLQFLLGSNGGDLIETLCILTECQKAMANQLSKAWKCDEQQANKITKALIEMRQRVSVGDYGGVDGIKKELQESCNTPILAKVYDEIVNRI